MVNFGLTCGAPLRRRARRSRPRPVRAISTVPDRDRARQVVERRTDVAPPERPTRLERVAKSRDPADGSGRSLPRGLLLFRLPARRPGVTGRVLTATCLQVFDPHRRLAFAGRQTPACATPCGAMAGEFCDYHAGINCLLSVCNASSVSASNELSRRSFPGPRKSAIIAANFAVAPQNVGQGGLPCR